MKKTAYLAPEAIVVTVVPQRMIAFSGNSEEAGDPKVIGTPDDDDEPNRSRHTYNCWEEEEWDD